LEIRNQRTLPAKAGAGGAAGGEHDGCKFVRFHHFHDTKRKRLRPTFQFFSSHDAI